MIAALKVTEESKSGRQRLNRWRRAKNDQATKLRSHYQYKIWETGVEGNRVARSTTYSQNADLISTAYYNPATRTITVYALAFDLDYDKADARWKTDGKLDWLRIKAFLHEQGERVIVEKIIAATRSSSGRGIGLTLAVSPLEMIDSTLRAQRSAFALQLHVIGILNGYGMGADPAAIGLVRDQPNYHNHEKIIEYNAWQKASVDNGRVAVVSELLKYTNAHRFIRYQKKSDRLEDLLCADARVEPKLAKLYLELFENHFMKSGDYRFSELQKITALSKSTLYRYLKTPPPWLNVERLNKYEGYRLSLVLTYRLYPRACELMTGVPPARLSKPSRRAFVVGAKALKPPAQVADGERNEYLTQVALTLKHGGIELSRAVEVVGGLVRGIPGAHSSRNCRSYAGILRSIYKNKPSLFGIKAHAGEGELLLVNSKTGFSKTECPTSFKKGIPEGYSLSPGARSVDGAKRTGNSVTGQLGECEGFSLMLGGDRVTNTIGNDSKYFDFKGDILPTHSFPLKNHGLSQKLQQSEKEAKVLIPFEAQVTTDQISKDISTIYKDLFTANPSVTENYCASLRRFKSRYEENLKKFSNRHPLDRFEAAVTRLMGRYSLHAIYERLFQVYCDIVTAGHKDKYQGNAKDYLPKRNPFRRVVFAFLLLPISMQKEVLSTLYE